MTESAMPLVTIAIPTYNRPHDLKKIIQIAVGQTHQNLEILIVDNCSTQPEVAEVMQWAAALDPRIRCHRNQENYGVLKNARCAFWQILSPAALCRTFQAGYLFGHFIVKFNKFVGYVSGAQEIKEV